jgi:hypothetical protein
METSLYHWLSRGKRRAVAMSSWISSISKHSNGFWIQTPDGYNGILRKELLNADGESIALSLQSPIYRSNLISAKYRVSKWLICMKTAA